MDICGSRFEHVSLIQNYSLTPEKFIIETWLESNGPTESIGDKTRDECSGWLLRVPKVPVRMSQEEENF